MQLLLTDQLLSLASASLQSINSVCDQEHLISSHHALTFLGLLTLVPSHVTLSASSVFPNMTSVHVINGFLPVEALSLFSMLFGPL